MKLIKKVLSILLLVLLTINLTIYTTKADINEDLDEAIDILDENSIKASNNEISNKPLRVPARNAIAIDSKTNEVLWEQKAYEIVPMASTTKILTSLIAINYGNLERKVTISKNASSIRGSTVGYRAGEEVAMRELLFGLMFKSGNDAAIAIAEDIGGSVEGFSKIMNDYAKSIGIIDSHFESPHGLDSQKHYSSAYDLAILTSKAMEYDFFREIVGEKTISRDKYNFTRDYQNINKILYRIPEANGVKTGYTGGAGKCLVSSVRYNDRNIIIVVLNCVERWKVTEDIFNYVVNNITFKDTTTKNIINESKFSGLAEIIKDEDFTYGYKENDSIDIEVLSKSLDINEGDILGKIFLKDDIKEKTKFPLKSNTNINKEEFNRIILGESEE